MKILFAAMVTALALSACATVDAGQGCSDELVARYQRLQTLAAQQTGPASEEAYAILGEVAVNPPGHVTVIGVSDVPFCNTNPKAVLCAGNRSKTHLTLEQVRAIDARLRAEFRYVSDEVMYGKWDWWVNNRTCGDCEDYALILSERLSEAGQSGSAMGLMMWAPYQGAAHATLMVRTKDVGVVEVGVGPRETPKSFVWTTGFRAAYMPMDGKRNWILAAH